MLLKPRVYVLDVTDVYVFAFDNVGDDFVTEILNIYFIQKVEFTRIFFVILLFLFKNKV